MHKSAPKISQLARSAQSSYPEGVTFEKKNSEQGNPFAQMTDREMLLFNPNYQNYLNRLKGKQAEKSELGRLLSEANDGKEPIRKYRRKDTALFAYVRETKPQ